MLMNQKLLPSTLLPYSGPTMANLLSLLSLLLLQVPLIASSVSTSSLLYSIDCGAADSYNGSNSFQWVGDERYISTGESRVVENADSVPHVLRTLRVFSTRKKNCYSFGVDKGSKILVRANFYYGNYDNRSSPPSFDLHFDGNYWDTVTTLMNFTIFYEVIYVTKGDTTSVCVAQSMLNQLPFISSLAVRSLDADMYNRVTADYALFMITRFAFGANKSVRYPDDEYDRIWIPAQASDPNATATSVASSIDTNITDKPPKTVLQTAWASTDISPIVLPFAYFLSTKVPVYINAYFSEVAQLDSNHNRSIQILINNFTYGDAFVPPYESVWEQTIFNLDADMNTIMTLVPTADSTLPPIINALEIFRVSDDVITNGTDSNDVQALSSLQKQFKKLQEWRGDPCLPDTFNWEWVACSTDPIPRITALYLNGSQLEGPLPDFSALDALRIIDMHNNILNGEIPDFLGKLPSLKQLNLADNNFSGPIPLSLSNKNEIQLDVSRNPNLCVPGKQCETGTSPMPSPHIGNTGLSMGKKKSKLPVILGMTIPFFLIICAVVGFLVLTYRRRKAAGFHALTKPGGPPATMRT